LRRNLDRTHRGRKEAAGDPILTMAMLDRVLHHATVVLIAGESSGGPASWHDQWLERRRRSASTGIAVPRRRSFQVSSPLPSTVSPRSLARGSGPVRPPAAYAGRFQRVGWRQFTATRRLRLASAAANRSGLRPQNKPRRTHARFAAGQSGELLAAIIRATCASYGARCRRSILVQPTAQSAHGPVQAI
jgi:hypothetical protein